MILIENITPIAASDLCRRITHDLPEYFGLPQANEHYAIGVRSRNNFAARIDSKYVGLISIDFPYSENANIYWMGILPKFHNMGAGRKLIEAVCDLSQTAGAKTISVETLSPMVADDNYLKTYKFYQSMGFLPLFDLKPSGYSHNMVYMAKILEENITKNENYV